MPESREPIHFYDEKGVHYTLNPSAVAAVQDDHHYPGDRYRPGCTVFLTSNEKLHIAMSSRDLCSKLWPSEARHV